MAPITDDEWERVYLSTYDPNGPIDHFPAVTTLLYKHALGNHDKLEELCELVKLFINKDRELHGRASNG